MGAAAAALGLWGWRGGTHGWAAAVAAAAVPLATRCIRGSLGCGRCFQPAVMEHGSLGCVCMLFFLKKNLTFIAIILSADFKKRDRK